VGKVSLTVEEQERIKVLHAEGKTYHAIAKEVGRSPHTVKGYLVSPTVQEEVIQIKGELADTFEDVAKRMVASITDEDIKKLDAYRRTLSGGIATDKMRLLRNESTDNVSLIVKLIQQI
jgi:predicted transcriptional regulator